jgi:hypothetical protein
MIKDCGLVIPSEKTLLTREIKKFKSKKQEAEKKAKAVMAGANDDIDQEVTEFM